VTRPTPVAGTTLVFLRHCQSWDNIAGVFANRPPGAGLSDLGRVQAQSVADRLRGMNIAAVHTSTAARAIETGTAIADTCAVPIATTSALLEYDFGTYEGSTDPSTGLRARDVLHQWVVHGDLSARMDGGETGTMVVARFRAAVEDIAVRHAGSTVAIVSHVGTLTIGLLTLCRNLCPDIVWGAAPPHGVPIVVETTATGHVCLAWPNPRRTG